jgi:hypothetical protein
MISGLGAKIQKMKPPVRVRGGPGDHAPEPGIVQGLTA